MSRYLPHKKQWCAYCRTLVIIDREITEYPWDGKVFEIQRCTRCDNQLKKNDITAAVAKEKFKTNTILVPDMSMVDSVHKTKNKA